jgi:polysaccharide pyruvyl transferase WcaK-like protein
LGDQIITEAVKKSLADCLPDGQVVSVPSHDFLGIHSYKQLHRSEVVFVGGSNLLSSNMPFYRQWKLRVLDFVLMPRVVLLGVGWWQYQKRPNFFTRLLLKKVLSKTYIHSVRDEYTRKMLNSIGVTNVINTGCPTMWGLDKDWPVDVSRKRKVIATVTDYNFDAESEGKMFEVLLKEYDEVCVWLQGDLDRSVLERLGVLGRVTIIGPSLDLYRNALDVGEFDYIGTRLHAGIYALQRKCRALIVAIDNRAAEIAGDTGLEVIKRGDVDQLYSWIKSDSRENLKINRSEINRFCGQFSSNCL